MRVLPVLAALVVVLAGCAQKATNPVPSTAPAPETPIATFLVSDVGRDGPEPSIGITASGCAFFLADIAVMRSCNGGLSWEQVASPLQAPTTSDPYLWVDPVTNRIFDLQMLSTQGTWIAWSDDDGATWLANPLDMGTVPDIDHIKLATGPWTNAGFGPVGKTLGVYDQATYFCHNSGEGVLCYTSFDGGMTFPVGSTAIGAVLPGEVTNPTTGLHGAISTAPDGTVYVPPRTEVPEVAVSHDNGYTWSVVQLGQDAGTPNPRKNPEVAADTASNAYYTWIGKDFGVYVSRSTDGGKTWDTTSLRASPSNVISTTFPHIQAGDPGRIALAYLGSTNKELLGTDDIDKKPWGGNPHYAPEGVTYDLYVTFSLDALAANPTWHTVKVTGDPVQAGSICISSGDCRTDAGRTTTNRNLLDFNDLSMGRDGRLYIAFADGCRGECAHDGSPEASDSRARRGTVAIQETGPSLYATKGDLKPL